MENNWINNIAKMYSQVNESKFLIPEEVPANERTAFHGAAAAAHKDGKSHFEFGGKKYPVTMKKDVAKAIMSDTDKGDLEEAKFTDKQIKMAIGIASDKRYAKGNMTGAVTAIDKIEDGLSDHPKVRAVLKRQNESIKEDEIDEISKKTLGSYVKKASDDRAQNALKIGKSGEINFKGLKRRAGINKAVNRLAKEEVELDEVLDSPGAMARYRKKADDSGNRARNSATRKILKGPNKDGKRADHSDELKTMKKRNKGQDMADRVAAKQFRKSMGLGYSSKKEEVALDEAMDQKKFSAGAKAIKAYAQKNGGVDKKDFMEVSKLLDQIGRVNILQAGQLLGRLNRLVDGMDTDVRERIFVELKKVGLMESVNESKYGTQAQRLMSPLQKARQDKEKRDRDRDGKLKSTALPMRKNKNEEIELDEEVFAIDIDYNDEKSLAKAAKAAGIAAKFVQAGAATEMQLRGDKNKIIKFLKVHKFPASEISRGWFKEEVELDEAMDEASKGKPKNTLSQKQIKRALSGMKVKSKDQVSLKKTPWDKLKEDETMICKDCGDEFGKPQSDCSHDCNDENGSNWITKEFHAKKDMDESYNKATQGPSNVTRDNWLDQLKSRKGEEKFVKMHDPQTPEFADGPTVNNKTFKSFLDAIKTAPKRAADNTTGDTKPVNPSK